MSANGTFEVQLTPQEDAEAPVGRMLIKKSYVGDMSGSGVGQMISKRIEDGAAVYFAIEEFSGTVMGKSGGFTLLHKGYMQWRASERFRLHGHRSGRRRTPLRARLRALELKVFPPPAF